MSNPEPLGPHCTVAPITTLTAALLQGCAEGSAHLALLPRRGQEVCFYKDAPRSTPHFSCSQDIPESDTGDSRELK